MAGKGSLTGVTGTENELVGVVSGEGMVSGEGVMIAMNGRSIGEGVEWGVGIVGGGRCS